MAKLFLNVRYQPDPVVEALYNVRSLRWSQLCVASAVTAHHKRAAIGDRYLLRAGCTSGAHQLADDESIVWYATTASWIGGDVLKIPDS